MTFFDQKLMLEVANALTSRGTPIDPGTMLGAMNPKSDGHWDMTKQFPTGKVKTIWLLDSELNYWKPVTHNIWALPTQGFVGTEVSLHQPVPYLVAWLGKHKPWLDKYAAGEDLLHVIDRDLSTGDGVGRDVFYRYISGESHLEVNVRYPWLFKAREAVLEQALSTGCIETPYGTRLKVRKPELAFCTYLAQIVRDITRIGVLTLYKNQGYVPYTILPGSVIVPNPICYTYADAFNMATKGKYSFSLAMERLR
jgi:hypothetical protein